MEFEQLKNYFINIKHSLKSFDDDEFNYFCNTVEDTKTIIREKKRNDYEDVMTIAKKLNNLGASLDAAEILYYDYLYYLKKDDYINAYRNVSGIISNGLLGADSPFFLNFLNEIIENIGNNSKYMPFLGFLYNIKGIYVGSIHGDYETSKYYYKKAITICEKYNPEEFKNITRREISFLYLIKNNYADANLQILYNSGYNKKLVDESLEYLKCPEKISDRYRISNRITLAEFLIFCGKEKEGKEILNKLDMKGSPVYKGWIKETYKKIRANTLYFKQKYADALELSLEYFSETIQSEQVIQEQISLNFYCNMLLKILSKEKNGLSYRKKKFFINNLLRILHKKDWYYGRDHSREVRDLSVKIGEKFKLKQNKMEILTLGALFHDIGKLNIPWFTLNKTSPITEIDRDLLKSHCDKGGAFLDRLELNNISYIAKNHHERLNGSGYPLGTNKMGLITQIVAVADIYTAATTPNRKYRKAKDADTMIKELMMYKDNMFEGNIIDTFVAYLKQGM
jgi:HD-GYP domain-containing protein (c-di-GMP phosphodiesterase class II)